MRHGNSKHDGAAGRIIWCMRAAIGRTLTVAALAGCGYGWAGALADAMPDAQRNPNFASDVAPLVLDRCAPCHRPGRAAPFPMLSYDDVRSRGKDIAAAVAARRMPPWPATQGPGFPALLDDPRLTDKQIEMIARWVRNGMPAGNLRRAPVPPPFPMPWPLGTPDITIDLPYRIAVPAGADTTVTVVVPLGFPADLWMGAIDYEPGASGVVRDARFFLAPPDLEIASGDLLPGVGGLLGAGSLENYGDRLFAAARGLTDLGAWTPGLARRMLPGDLAIRAPERANIVLQLHLRAGVTDTTEDGRIGVYFAGPLARTAVTPIEVPPASGMVAGLSIPAGEPRFVLADALVLPVDVRAVGARAYAHALARDMTMTAALPDGTTRGLLRIDQWNPGWPATGYFTAPMRLPKGTAIRVEIAYDNSAGNPRNLFTPPRPVVWGRTSVGEMGGMTLLVAGLSPEDAQAIDDAVAAHLRDQLLRRR
jgi:mono/diheme cytochrome c family protein